MSFIFKAWHLLLMIAAGAAQQDHQRAIEYLMAEKRVLKRKLGKKRIPLTDDNGKKFILMDRDSKFSEAFREIIDSAGTECVRLPARSPNLNAQIERFMRSIKEECLSRMIFFGEKALRNATIEYLQHFHSERNHQGLKNKIIQPDASVGARTGTVECRERLGGLLRYYHPKAA